MDWQVEPDTHDFNPVKEFVGFERQKAKLLKLNKASLANAYLLLQNHDNS